MIRFVDYTVNPVGFVCYRDLIGFKFKMVGDWEVDEIVYNNGEIYFRVTQGMGLARYSDVRRFMLIPLIEMLEYI